MRLKQILLSYFQGPVGVRATLATLVLGCVLPMAGMAAFLLVDFYTRETAELVASTISQARATVAAVDRHFDSVEAALLALSTSRQLDDGDLRGFHERAQKALVHLNADSIIIIDLDGALRLSTRRPFGTPLPRLAKTPLLQRIRSTGKPGVSDLFMGPLAGQLIYTVGVPVMRHGAVAFSLNATETTTYFDRLIASQHFPPGWRIAILDSSAAVVARSHDGERFRGKLVLGPLKNALAGAAEGSVESTTLDGVAAVTAYSRSPSTGWTVALGIPRDELTASLRHSFNWLIIATLAALALGLALAWRLGGRIVHAMLALVEPAKAVGSGQVLPIPRLGIAEANVLGRTLHDAAISVRESEQRLALVAEAAHLGIWIRDLAHDAIWVSEQWRNLFGFAHDQVIRLDDVLARVHADDRAAVAQVFDSTRRGARRYEMEYRLEVPGQAQCWIASIGSVENDRAGRPALVRGVSLDITRRKQAELDIQHKQKEVTLLSRVAVLGELSGAMAHELNQPLTAILSNAQAAQRFLRQPEPALGEVAEILQDIVDEDQRAGEIIRRLRRLFDKAEGVRETIDANELVQSVLRILRNDLINHGVALHSTLCEAELPVQADRIQLQQVLINLLMNACDAMAGHAPGERSIEVRSVAESASAAIRIDVLDRGPGIPEAQLERVFDAFYTTKERGMGLGLSICRNIVLAHGGQLWASTRVGGGAAFHVRLPVPAP
ncbi:MAG: ATP-binding protein [Pseudomonadota bacterium]